MIACILLAISLSLMIIGSDAGRRFQANADAAALIDISAFGRDPLHHISAVTMTRSD